MDGSDVTGELQMAQRSLARAEVLARNNESVFGERESGIGHRIRGVRGHLGQIQIDAERAIGKAAARQERVSG